MPKIVKEIIPVPVAKRKYTKSPKLPPRPAEPQHTSHAFLTFLIIINLVATSWIVYQIYDAKYLQEVPQETPSSDPYRNLQ